MISGRTRLVALLGHPVAHSLSPRMQNAAFAALALDFAYVAFDVPPERLESAVRGLAEIAAQGRVAIGNCILACENLEQARARAGGNLGETNSVAWQFEAKGLITIPVNGSDADEIAPPHAVKIF